MKPEKSHFEKWCDIIAKTPSSRSIQPVEVAPKDGTTHVFRIILDLEAFWCDEAKRWVLAKPLNLDYLPLQADHIPSDVGRSGETKT